MGLFSWVKRQYVAAGETINNVIQTTKIISQEFWQGFTHFTNVWVIFESPADYPKTLIAWVAAQKAVLKRFMQQIAYLAIARPLVMHSVRWTTGGNYGAELVVLGTMDIFAGGYLIREATTAKFFDNSLYYAAVGYTSAVESNAVISKKKEPKNVLEQTCGDGELSYYIADFTNTVEYGIHALCYSAAPLTPYLFSILHEVYKYVWTGEPYTGEAYMPYPIFILLEVYKCAWTGEPYMRYPMSAARMCKKHQEKIVLENPFYAVGVGASYHLLHRMCLFLLNAALPAETSVLGEGVKNYCLSEVIATTLALGFVISHTLKRDPFPGKTVRPNLFYPAKAISRHLAVDVADEGQQQYANAKAQDANKWEQVIFSKVKNAWNWRVMSALRNALINHAPESWEQLAQRESVKVYWKASDGSLRRGVKFLLELHESKLSNSLRWAALDRWVSNLPWIGGEMKVGVPVLLKSGTGRALRAAVNVLDKMAKDISPESIDSGGTTPPLLRRMIASYREGGSRVGVLKPVQYNKQKIKRLTDSDVATKQADEEIIEVAFLDVEAVVEEPKKIEKPVTVAYVLEREWVERTNALAPRPESPLTKSLAGEAVSRVGVLRRRKK